VAQKVQPIPRISNHVVARFRDGRTIKGVTHDFGPQKKFFHVTLTGEKSGKALEVLFSDLKAVFFVKSLEGKKDHPPAKTGSGTKVKITFFDGETLTGTTYGYTPDREGFFIVPLEEDSNNLRIFIISDAVKQIESRK
jgi:hypothetical protein